MIDFRHRAILYKARGYEMLEFSERVNLTQVEAMTFCGHCGELIKIMPMKRKESISCVHSVFLCNGVYYATKGFNANECVTCFNQKHGTNASEEQVIRFKNAFIFGCADLKLGRREDINFSFAELNKGVGSVNSQTREVKFSTALFGNEDYRMENVVLHELRHLYQLLYNPTITAGYIRADQDLAAYKEHPCEVDADAYARQAECQLTKESHQNLHTWW